MAPVNGPKLQGSVPPSPTPIVDPNATLEVGQTPAAVGHAAADQFVAPNGPTPAPTPAATPAPAPTPTPATAPAVTWAADGSDVPYIPQLAPIGADANYTGGSENCGPTAMAMIGRFYGLGGTQSDAQFIEQLAKIGGTLPADPKNPDAPVGTTPVGMQAMAQALGLHHAIRGASVAKTMGPNFSWNLAFIDQHLAAGHKIIAQGNWASEPTHEGDAASSHYIAVVGKSPSGDYMISDPEDPFLLSMTSAELSHYIDTDPADGGTVMALAK